MTMEGKQNKFHRTGALSRALGHPAAHHPLMLVISCIDYIPVLYHHSIRIYSGTF